MQGCVFKREYELHGKKKLKMGHSRKGVCSGGRIRVAYTAVNAAQSARLGGKVGGGTFVQELMCCKDEGGKFFFAIIMRFLGARGVVGAFMLPSCRRVSVL